MSSYTLLLAAVLLATCGHQTAGGD